MRTRIQEYLKFFQKSKKVNKSTIFQFEKHRYALGQEISSKRVIERKKDKFWTDAESNFS